MLHPQEFNTDTRNAYRKGLYQAKEIILAEQKEKTNFDVITESPEKLAYWLKLISVARIEVCLETGEINFNDNGLVDYLNQKAEEE